MSNKLLEPTYENLINHYLHDTIGRNEDLFYFVRMLSELDGGSAVALNGAWGSGKTFFVKQAKMLIDIHNPNSDIDIEISDADERTSIKGVYNNFNVDSEAFEMQKIATVYYDAWKYDDSIDPLLSLIYCIIIRYNENINPNKIKWMKNALVKSLPLFNGLVKSVTGLDLKETLEGLKNILEVKEDWFQQIKKENDIEKQVNQFITDIVSEEDKLIIFIDELDRCNPQYAVKLLERVKHYFNHQKVVFVISYNKMELQHSIKTLYGAEFSADKYLERFFDYEIGLRSIDVDKYFDSFGSNNSIMNSNMNAMTKMYKFQMRDICKYHDCMKKAVAKFSKITRRDIHSVEQSLQFYIIWFMPFIVALHFHNENDYRKFLDGEGFDLYSDLFRTKVNQRENMFRYLLNDNEKYSANDGVVINNIAQISLKSKFQQAYRAMFKENITITLGDIEVDNEVRSEFYRICNGISSLADYK